MKRTLTVGTTSVDKEGLYGSYPRIRLQGNWLSKLGFSPNDTIHVSCNINQIIITKAKDDNDNHNT